MNNEQGMMNDEGGVNHE